MKCGGFLELTFIFLVVPFMTSFFNVKIDSNPLCRFFVSICETVYFSCKDFVHKRQSHKGNLVFKKSKLVLNSVTVHYFNLEYTTLCYDLNCSNTPARNLRLL